MRQQEKDTNSDWLLYSIVTGINTILQRKCTRKSCGTPQK